MFKRIRKYFAMRRRVQIEVLETLATICLYLNHEGHLSHNHFGQYMQPHFQELKSLSRELREMENKTDT